ncbi:MAG: response regulator [Deltaproteobacteria bacterium]|nr:response regulator [Deltaproteobacteria bacterium]
MSYSILIVDDSATIRSVIKRSIGMTGIDVGAVHEAANGLEALEVLGREWVDIVFADLNMPEMNGVELVERMFEDSMLVSTPVVIVSSDHNQRTIDGLKERGIRAYIKKPFRPENFRDVVGEVLGLKKE